MYAIRSYYEHVDRFLVQVPLLDGLAAGRNLDDAAVGHLVVGEMEIQPGHSYNFV